MKRIIKIVFLMILLGFTISQQKIIFEILFRGYSYNVEPNMFILIFEIILGFIGIIGGAYLIIRNMGKKEE